MKKKTGGITGSISQLFTFVIVAGLLIALLARFDWDILAVLEWIGSFIVDAVLTVANFFAGNRTFQRLTA